MMLRRQFSLLATAAHRIPTEGNKLTALLEAQVEHIPTKNVLNFQTGERLAVMEVTGEARALGAGLASLKYSTKDTILVALPNNVDRLSLQLAAAYAGCKVALVDEAASDVDMAACIKAVRPRGVFVSTSLVPNVRAAVPELVLAGTTKEKNPRHFRGNTMQMMPIGSPDFPELKQVFHTGTSREPRFHLLKHVPLYFPVPHPLEDVKYASDNEAFFSVVSKKGEVTNKASRADLLKTAGDVANSLKLRPDESVMMCTKGDPYSMMIGFLACAGTFSQLVVPNPKEPNLVDAFAEVEKVSAAIGDVNVPKRVGQRVSRI